MRILSLLFLMVLRDVLFVSVASFMSSWCFVRFALPCSVSWLYICVYSVSASAFLCFSVHSL